MSKKDKIKKSKKKKKRFQRHIETPITTSSILTKKFWWNISNDIKKSHQQWFEWGTLVVKDTWAIIYLWAASVVY